MFKQILNLLRQNPFHAAVCVIGTAVTIAFVMVVAMIYDFRTADMAPEADRSRMMYTGTGRTEMAADGTMRASGMGRVAFEALFDSLPGVEALTWYGQFSRSVCSLPATADRYPYLARYVAANWFRFFSYRLLAGRTFTQEEYDAARQSFVETTGDSWRNRKPSSDQRHRVVVLTEHVAAQLFGGAAEAVGKVMWIDFMPARVVGVVADVSSIFQTAYAEVFLPFSLVNERAAQSWTNELGGVRRGVLRLKPGTSPQSIRAEVERREALLNSTGLEYRFHMERMYTHTEYTFFRDTQIDARLLYALLVLVLMVVPAISISGLMNAQMQSRLSEIAVRKAYGASGLSIIGRLFSESLLTTLMGGVVGYLLSCLLVWMGRAWLFGLGGTVLTGIAVDGSLLMRPALFLTVLAVCVVFNALSVLLPAWIAVRRNISSTLKGGE